MMKGFKFIVFFVAVIFVGVVWTDTVSARTSAVENQDAGLSQAKEFAAIAGFSSARFGMTQEKILKAIRKDFNMAESDVKRENNVSEKTLSLIVDVADLLPDGSTASEQPADPGEQRGRTQGNYKNFPASVLYRKPDNAGYFPDQTRRLLGDRKTGQVRFLSDFPEE